MSSNSCGNSNFRDTAFISAPLEAVNLRCDSVGLNGLSLVWGGGNNASGYELRVNGGNTVVVNDTFYRVTGLLPGQEVTWSILPLGSGPCGNGPLSEGLCRSLECPMISLDFSSIDTFYCLGSDTGRIALLPVVSGGSG
ncbi:MAG: hypothetical protein HC821_03575 [Lewinella sp.]|nr:hypothetical protein [Lewinella sp.]